MALLGFGWSKILACWAHGALHRQKCENPMKRKWGCRAGRQEAEGVQAKVERCAVFNIEVGITKR